MPKFLIDANLPYFFSLWNTDEYLHVKDLDDTWSDEIIWQYAKENNLTIITKDADFSIKALYKGVPPKVIHLKFGNLKLKDFHALLNKVWVDVIELIQENNIVNIYSDRIENIK